MGLLQGLDEAFIVEDIPLGRFQVAQDPVLIIFEDLQRVVAVLPAQHVESGVEPMGVVATFFSNMNVMAEHDPLEAPRCLLSAMPSSSIITDFIWTRPDLSWISLHLTTTYVTSLGGTPLQLCTTLLMLVDPRHPTLSADWRRPGSGVHVSNGGAFLLQAREGLGTGLVVGLVVRTGEDWG